MAKQHFYSRVPARMSMFNKEDSCDTFAISEGVNLEEIKNELSVVNEIKFAKEETQLIQMGQLSPVYIQLVTQNGTLAQTAISYLSRDYTGERASYMSHTLLLNDKEKKEHLCSCDNAAFNTNCFKHDLSNFDFSSFDAKPITDCPDLPIPTQKADSLPCLLENYDNGMIKRLIYSLVAISCGKAKSLFLCFNTPMNELSQKSVSFLNTVLLLFPYHIRESLSFVSYSSDYNKFNSIKIKCMVEEDSSAPTSKGITLKMDIKDFAGVTDENIAANAMVVDFFYELISKEDIRKEFFRFCDTTIQNNDSLKKPTLKNITDLVLLFKVLGGFYSDRNVLKNDVDVYNYICVYDKNKEFLNEEYRSKSMEFLTRYPETQTAIPKNVFSKVSSIYPNAVEVTRHTVMETVLALIHTDTMREKLFTFIKNNFDSENDENKQIIFENICRVYYGGFLQKQILEFLSNYFTMASDDVKVNIVERLLLTVRSQSIQDEIVGFIDKYYSLFSDAEKNKFYQIFFDVLADADPLSRKLADIIDKYLEDSRKDDFKQNFIDIVNADSKICEKSICAVICTKCGTCESLIASKVFSGNCEDNLFSNFAFAVSKKDILSITDTFNEIWEVSPDLSEDLSNKFFDMLCENISNDTKPSFFTLISAYEKLEELKDNIPSSKLFIDKFENNIVCSNALMVFPTVFDVKKYPDGLNQAFEISNKYDFLKNSKEFVLLNSYFEALDSIKHGNNKTAFEYLEKIEGKPVRQGAAVHLKKDTDELTADNNKLLILLALDYLSFDGIRFVEATSKLAEQIVDDELIDVSLAIACDIYNSKVSDELKNLLICENSNLSDYISSYISSKDKKAKKEFLLKIDTLETNEEFKNVIKSFVNASRSANSGFFSKLFKK